MSAPGFILTLSCPNRTGIVAGVSGYLFEQGCNITDSAQLDDALTGRFFMRVAFRAEGAERSCAPLADGFAKIAARFGMDWRLHDAAERPRVLLMVSRFGHCLNDLLFRHQVGALKIDIPAIVSNHRDHEALAAAHQIPFHHLPVDPANKAAQEAALRALIAAEKIDLVVLARYMQVLSTSLCAEMSGQVINIHHSFLPSFKGATPYQQAHRRGVKLIGATAHYVTEDLDEGPIIEQDVARVDHAMTPDDFVAVGRDVECVVLSRAVKWHAERRVLLNGNKTVVFR